MLPWTLASLLLLALLGAGLLWLWRARASKKQTLPVEWELNPRPVFNSDERRVFRHLRDALPQHVVLSKLPLVRFSQAADPRQVRYWYELLGNVSVAFAVCSANGRVLLAIDLEGESTTSKRTMQIKHAALAACRVRYLRCAADRLPSAPELQALVPAVPNSLNGGSALANMAHDDHANVKNAYLSGAMPLDPAHHPMRENLGDSAGSQRRPLGALWQDAGFMQESFYATDGAAGPSDGRSTTEHDDLLQLPDDVGGIVIDTPISPLRH
jgi:Protein of unknown function (DUF2726)